MTLSRHGRSPSSRLLGLLLDETTFPIAEYGADADADRRLLRILLTMRPPTPIPAWADQEIDALLRAETAGRPLVAALEIPTLSATHPGAPAELGTRAAFWRGDLTNLVADAIVNAANSRMLGCFIPDHRCIDNVIHNAAGPRLRAECARHMDLQGAPEPTGTATVTAAHALPAEFVIHTVGPVVSGRPTAEDAALLRSCYLSILDAAEERGLRSVGFCSISTGVFGYPKPDGARVALAALADWYRGHPSSSLRAVISLFEQADVDAYDAALAGLGS